MKQVTRVFIFFALALMLIGSPALSVFAQDGESDCPGLSDADCQFLQDARTDTSNLNSVSVPSWNVFLNMSAEGESVFFEANGSAALWLPGELIALRDTLMSIETVTPDTLFLILDEIDSDTVQASLNDTFLSLVVDSLSLQSPEESLSGGGALLVKDGMIYLNLPTPSGEATWFGEPLELSRYDLAQLDAAIAGLRVELLEEDTDAAFEAAGGMIILQRELAALAQQYTLTTREPDEVIDGETTAVFTTTFDVQELLADPSLPSMLLTLLEDLAAQSPEMADVNLNQAQLQLVLLALNLVIDEGALTSTQWIGLNDGFVHRMTFDALLELDPSLFADQEDLPASPIGFSLSFMVDLRDFNRLIPDSVIPPGDFVPGDELENYLVGTPDQIEGALAPGDVIDRTLSDDDMSEIFALPLDVGQSVTLTLESDRYTALAVYNPNGFLLDELTGFARGPVRVTAQTAGVHFVTVEAFTALDYQLTVSAE